MRVTINRVNAALKEASGDPSAELVHNRSAGYFYFWGNEAASWRSQGVYGVYRLNDLSLERWIAEYLALRDDNQCA